VITAVVAITIMGSTLFLFHPYFNHLHHTHSSMSVVDHSIWYVIGAVCAWRRVNRQLVKIFWLWLWF
jgi:hypothetical protein